MFCLTLKIFQSGFATGAAYAPAATSFVKRAAALKKRFRGKGLYSFARDEAQKFLDSEVPKTNIDAWMEEGTNAVALSQVLRFFEIVPDFSLSSLLLNRLIRFAEDANAPPSQRLEAVLALMSSRPDENYERAFAAVEGVLQSLNVPLATGSASLSSEAHSLWSVLDLCAKVLQRCGKRVTPALNDRLAQAVMSQLQSTPPDQLFTIQRSLLRIYAWMVRAELPQSTGLLFVMVEHTGDFESYDFATLMRSCSRHHQVSPLPVSLVLKLAQSGLLYASTCNGGDASAILGGIARVLSSMEPGVNDVQVSDVRTLNDNFNALLEDFQCRALRFMDHADSLYWQGIEDITNIAFAFELGGRLRYRRIFTHFLDYVQREVSRMEPQQLAMATGILRRSQLLSPNIATLLSDRIEVILGELRLSELSHICATFSTLPSPPRWMNEALAIAIRLMQGTENINSSAATRFNFAIAFPQETFALPVAYAQMSARQLVDALPLALGKPAFEVPVINALVHKLQDSAVMGRFSTDDVVMLLSAPNEAVVQAVQKYMEQCLTSPEWTTDILFTLPIAMQNSALHPLAAQPAKALASAKNAAISPELFVALLELLVSIWKDTDAGINEFAVVGGTDLIQAPRLLGATLTRYLNCVRQYPAIYPNTEWVSQLATRGQRILKSLRGEDLVGLLAAVHAMFSSVTTTPSLQPLLVSLVESCYQNLKEADVYTARATVLLVHLQQGMDLPLLTSSSPMVSRVVAAAPGYPQELQNAVKCMPLPQGSSSFFTGAGSTASSSSPGSRRGRFTVKAPGGAQDNFGSNDSASALNRASTDPLDFSEDPFASGGLESVASFNATPAGETAPNTASSTHSAREPLEFMPDLNPAPGGKGESLPSSGEGAPLSTLPSRGQDEKVEPSPNAAEYPPQEQQSSGGLTKAGSYYSKFFNSSIGLLFSGERSKNEMESNNSETNQNTTTAPEGAHNNNKAWERDRNLPRRTVLRPITPPPQQVESKPSGSKSYSSAPWGAASAWGKVPGVSSQTLRTEVDAWGLPTSPQSNLITHQQQGLSAPGSYSTPLATQNASFFSKTEMQTTVPPSSNAYGLQQRPPQQPVYMNYNFHSERGNSANSSLFMNQNNPLKQPLASAIKTLTNAQGQRFFNTRRDGLSFPNQAPAGLQGRNIFVDPTKGTNAGVKSQENPAGAQPRRATMRQPNFRFNENNLEPPTTDSAYTAENTRQDASLNTDKSSRSYLRQPTFALVSPDHPKAMEKNRNYSEQNLSSGPSSSWHPAGKRSGPWDTLLHEPADRPLAWRETAQQVSRVTRRAGKETKKTQLLLSEWLKVPEAKLEVKKMKRQVRGKDEKVVVPPKRVSAKSKRGGHAAATKVGRNSATSKGTKRVPKKNKPRSKSQAVAAAPKRRASKSALKSQHRQKLQQKKTPPKKKEKAPQPQNGRKK